eukprot:14464154-Alexandrium_andersonii.AAC.1
MSADPRSSPASLRSACEGCGLGAAEATPLLPGRRNHRRRYFQGRHGPLTWAGRARAREHPAQRCWRWASRRRAPTGAPAREKEAGRPE